MVGKWLSATAVMALISSAALADLAGDVQAGTDIDFDVKFMSVTYNSPLGSDSGTVDDEEAPRSRLEKAAGSLNMVIDANALGTGFNLLVPFNGSVVSPTRLKWTTDSNPNTYVQVLLNGSTVNVYVTRIYGQLTADLTPEPLFHSVVCNRGYNVRMDDTGSDTDSWLNVNGRINNSIFLPVTVQFRSIDVIAYGGVPRGSILPTANVVAGGTLLGGTLSSLFSSDDNKLAILNDEFNTDGESTATGASADPAPGKLIAHFEASASRPTLVQSLEAFNYTANDWSILDVRDCTELDAQVSVEMASPASNGFIQASTREIKLRARFFPSESYLDAPDWVSFVDQLRWESVP